MRFYFYSTELLTFVEAKWAKTTIAAGGILVGTFLFFGVLEPNQSVVNFRESRSARALAAENDMLRHHVSLISPRLSNMEATAGQLGGQVNALRTRLLRRQIAADSALRLTRIANGRALQLMVQATAGFEH